jgi:ABC-type bacteriocin/lantibiotic exporter with double-glycine peptidase domain
MLVIINLTLVIILAVVVIINFFSLQSYKNYVETQLKAVSGPSLVSMKEFLELEPEIKDIYNKNIAEGIAPKVMNAVNRYVKEGKNLEQLQSAFEMANKNVTQESIYQQIKKGGL